MQCQVDNFRITFPEPVTMMNGDTLTITYEFLEGQGIINAHVNCVEQAQKPQVIVSSVNSWGNGTRRPTAKFNYKNHRGEVEIRLVQPVRFYHGTTEYYSKPQFLLEAWDYNRLANRTFAMANVSDWENL